MLVYLHGSPDRNPPASHTKFIAPAAHLAGQECPHEWVDTTNKPIEFQIDFVHGKAEVDDAIGKYLVETGQAFRSRLIRPDLYN